MTKNPPSMREIAAGEQALRNKIRSMSKVAYREPTYEEEQAWRKSHPSPMEKYMKKVRLVEKALQAKADEIILAGRMGQISSSDFYSKVKAF